MEIGTRVRITSLLRSWVNGLEGEIVCVTRVPFARPYYLYDVRLEYPEGSVDYGVLTFSRKELEVVREKEIHGED